jgi:ATP phosphoribosyltransferase regulatory subunit HisZ
MTVDEYLKRHSLTYAAFGERIGVSMQSVHRYAKYNRLPKRSVMVRIIAATGGEVAPADFYDGAPPLHRSTDRPAFGAQPVRGGAPSAADKAASRGRSTRDSLGAAPRRASLR